MAPHVEGLLKRALWAFALVGPLAVASAPLFVPAAATPDIPDDGPLEYRCRRCAKVFHGHGQLDQEVPGGGQLLKIHEHCIGDERGLADLIGARWHIGNSSR